MPDRRNEAAWDKVQTRLKWMERALMVMGACIVITAGIFTGIPGTAVDGLFGQASQRAAESKDQADDLATLVDAIQTERVKNFREACETGNDAADRRQKAFKEFGVDPGTQRFIRRVLGPVVKRDCDQYVINKTKESVRVQAP